MKLAEALMERADLNRKVDQLRMRLVKNVLVQEGEKPSEDPNEIMVELDSAIERLEKLMGQINLTNCNTFVDGKSLTQIIAQKDSLLVQVSVYRDALSEAMSNTSRARGTEIKIRPTVKVDELRKKADELARQVRVLDNTLQMTNWSTDLME